MTSPYEELDALTPEERDIALNYRCTQVWLAITKADYSSRQLPYPGNFPPDGDNAEEEYDRHIGGVTVELCGNDPDDEWVWGESFTKEEVKDPLVKNLLDTFVSR